MKSAMRWFFLLIAMAAVKPAFGDLVVNGGFDNNCASWNWVRNSNFCDPGSGNPGSALILNDGPGPVPFAFQSISGLTLGTAYQITLDAKTWFNCCNDPSTPGAGVSIDGNQFDFLVVNNQPWTAYSFNFTYTGGSNVLTLSSQRNNTDSDAEFDNVALNASTSTPEPSSLILLSTIACLIGAGAFYRRKRIAAPERI